MRVLGALQQGLLGVYTTMWLGLYCPILGDLNLKNTMKGYIWVCFLCVSIAPFVFLMIVAMGQRFQVVSHILFLGFLPGVMELVVVTGSMMLQRRKYC
jgi:hypothetical protein